MKHICKTCEHFECEVRRGNGESVKCDTFAEAESHYNSMKG